MKFISKNVPLPSLIMLFLFVLSLILNFIFVANAAFSNFFNRHIASFFRFCFAKVSGVVPFSIAEVLIVLLPLIAVLLIYKSVRLLRSNFRTRVRFLSFLLSLVFFFYVSFVLLFASGYRGSTLDEKMQLQRAKVSGEELYFVSELMILSLTELMDEIDFGEDDFSNMPYTFGELNDKLNVAFSAISSEYSFLSDFSSTVKPVLLSEPMTYTHISGVYTYFTGEANVNTNFPSYTIPFTMAHEMAHQRGIAREDEANFVAFLVCMASDDAYIRYSGYLNMYEYLANALYSADKEAYLELYPSMPDEIRAEQRAYSKFFEKYKDNTVANISSSVNDDYLKSQGQSSGVKSYGLVVDLAVAFYKSSAK